MERKLVLVKFIDGTSETIEAYCSSRGGYYGYLTKKNCFTYPVLPPSRKLSSLVSLSKQYPFWMNRRSNGYKI